MSSAGSHLAFSQILQQKNGFALASGHAFVSLLKDCAFHKDLEGGCKLHAEIARMDVLCNDPFIGSSLVDMYSKCGSLVIAKDVFDNLPTCDVVCWTALIAGYTDHQRGFEALSLVEKMEQEGILSDSHTHVCSLKACANIGAINKGQQLHAEIAKRGMEGELFVGNALVDLYARNGWLEAAEGVFSKLQFQDVVTWNALITGYGEHGQEEEVFQSLQRMHCEGISPNAVTLVCALKACGTAGTPCQGQELHLDIAKKGLETEILIMNALVSMYAKCGWFNLAHEALENHQVQDVVAWTALLGGYIDNGCGEEALDCFVKMKQCGLELNVVTYVGALKACGSIEAITKGQEIHMEIVMKGLEGDLLIGNSLVDMYAKCGSLTSAQIVFNRLSSRDVVLWNALMGGYVEHGSKEEALHCLEQMEYTGILLNSATFLGGLKACGVLKDATKGCKLHAEIIRRGLEKDLLVGSTLVDMYGKCGLLVEAQVVFDRLVARNIISHNALMAGYAQHKCGEEALEYIDRIQQPCQTSFNSATFVCSLKACGNAGAVVKGQEIHSKAARMGLEGEHILGTILVDMYSKCGLLAEAHSVFVGLPHRDLPSWNALLVGYAQLGESGQAFGIFTKMLDEGIAPDVATVVSILNACSHDGLIVEAYVCFAIIVSNCALITTLEHFNCMIDLLGRAGHMDKVVVILERMPVHPDMVVWHTVLGACRKCGNAKLGRHVFEHVMLMDVKDVGAFISLFNICADAFFE